MIPHIIHQTWKNSVVPEHLSLLAETWKEKHSGWQYILWTDKMNRDFIEEHYPDFLYTYDNYPHNIQRVDAVRYFILYKTGGVFIDLDFECLYNIAPLLHNQTCVFGLEPDEHCLRFNKAMIICNAFMACEPQNHFFKIICTQLKNDDGLKYRQMQSWLQILESTGPFKLTSVFDKYEHQNEIKLLPACAIYPLSLTETRRLLADDEIMDEGTQERVDNAYAVHYFLGNWWE